MRLLQPGVSADGSDFDRSYPILAALRRDNPRLIGECERVWAIFDEFSRRCVDPIALQIDESGWGASPSGSLEAFLEQACESRFFTMSLPRSLGGQGVSMLAFTIGLERLAASCLGIANLVAVHGLGLGVMGAVGALTQLRQAAERIVEGERRGRPYLMATAATEPSAGSDIEDAELLAAADVQSQATLVEQGWSLNGTKLYVSNGSIASAYVVLMPTDRSRPVQTLSAFLVERHRAGLEIARVEHKLGQRACPAAELHFTNCIVPASHKLNQQTVAGKSLDMVLGSSRATVAAFGAGAACGAIGDCVKFCRDKSFGVEHLLNEDRARMTLSRMWQNARMARSSYIEALLANAHFGLVSLLESAVLRQLDRLIPSGIANWAGAFGLLDSELLNREARRWLEQLPTNNVATASAHSSAAKVGCSELALKNCQHAAELLGPWATLNCTGVPKRWRDARLLAIYEGTNEINSLDVYKKAGLTGGYGLYV